MKFGGVVVAVFYCIFAGLLPDYYIHKDYADGNTFVNLYSHLFRYGEFFSWITVLGRVSQFMLICSAVPKSLINTDPDELLPRAA